MVICHITTLPMEKMGSITRNIFNKCIGAHIQAFVWDTPPKADIYILHCFKKHHEKFRDFKADGFIISLLHSSDPCEPAKNSNLIVTISEEQNRRIKKASNFPFDFYDRALIYPGIEIPEIKYFRRQPTICKIARAEAGKFHPLEASVIDSITLDKKVNYTLICKEVRKVKNLIPESADIIESVEIADDKKRNAILSHCGIYADMHGDFGDTFCIALLEAMANGLACVVMRDEKNLVLDEVLGESGIVTDNWLSFDRAVRAFIDNPNFRETMGKTAYLRAKNKFSVERMIREWNQLIVEKWRFLSVPKPIA